jgi:hypothetical protein
VILYLWHQVIFTACPCTPLRTAFVPPRRKAYTPPIHQRLDTWESRTCNPLPPLAVQCTKFAHSVCPLYVSSEIQPHHRAQSVLKFCYNTVVQSFASLLTVSACCSCTPQSRNWNYSNGHTLQVHRLVDFSYSDECCSNAFHIAVLFLSCHCFDQDYTHVWERGIYCAVSRPYISLLGSWGLESRLKPPPYKPMSDSRFLTPHTEWTFCGPVLGAILPSYTGIWRWPSFESYVSSQCVSGFVSLRLYVFSLVLKVVE